MKDEETDINVDFEMDREKVERYFWWLHTLMVIALGLCLFGVGALLVIVYWIFFGPWLPRKQAEALKYSLDESTVRIEEGVYFLKRKAIPLERITDLVLKQGPLMRHTGIWALAIQTAGMGQGRPEGTLWGIRDHEQVREVVLAARDRLMRDRR